LEKTHLNITISGNVQGVGFRYQARIIALSYGIKGFVKNLSNGDVYIEVEGSQDKIDSFLYWCNQGPARSRVNDINSNKGEVINFTTFDIKF
jgi:acylphosphatase